MKDIRQDRSIRNIPVSEGARRILPQATNAPQDFDDYQNEEGGKPPPQRVRTPKRRSGGILWAVGGTVLVCAIAGLMLATFFEKAVVTVTAKTFQVPDKQNLSASQGAAEGSLSYQTITATDTATTTVKITGTQHVSKSATGDVVVYNTYNATPQKLAVNTRFSTKDGKMYRSVVAVTVPGVVKKPDGTLGPGTTRVKVAAEKPGSQYNQTGAVQLTLPGFKGDPRFTKIVAQSQGDIAGGFVGDEPAVSPAAMSAAESDLKRQLDSNIRSAALSQVPSGFVGVSGSLGVRYTSVQQTPGEKGTVTLAQSATATIAMLRVSDLASALAKLTVSDYKGEPVLFKDMTKTTILLVGNAQASTSDPIRITVGGAPDLVWTVDADAVKAALLGKKKADFIAIINGFKPSVATAEANIRPFWKATLPSDPRKLVVESAQ